jgi:hypothetical protein
VADEDRGDAELLGGPKQARRRFPHLSDGAGRRADLGGVERLNGVDHADVRPLGLERGADGVELGLGEDLNGLRAAQPGGSEAHLGGRLLAGDEEGAAALGDRPESSQQQGGLAHARLSAYEHERRRHEPAAEDAVELGHAGGDPLRLVGLDVGEAEEGLRRGLRPGVTREDVLDERSERAAGGALAQPAPGRVTALRAGVVDGSGLGHPTIVGLRADGDRAEAVTTSPC